MEIFNRRPGLMALIAFIAGLIIGLVVLGWGLFPVEYTGADPSGLFPEYQAIYVRNAAELYTFDNNQEKLRAALGGWGGDEVACALAQASTDPADQQRLVAAATIVNGTGCANLGTTNVTPPAGATSEFPGAATTSGEVAADEGGPGNLPLLLLLLLLVLLGVAIFYVWSRRRTLAESEPESDGEYEEVAPAVRKSPRAPVAAGAAVAVAAPAVTEPVAVPIARFRTIYTHGHDTYDDSFSIENAAGDFLGECGVGIAESIGPSTPRNVTAFEVWLFDKNDIRTITKVIMSDHAYFDEALKAKLAPKGEPVLARIHEPVVLETATLIINAEITEMEYGDSSDLPDGSYFDRFTIELSAWSKEGEYTSSPASENDEDPLRFP